MSEIKLSLEEIKKLKEYFVKTKHFELAAKIREWEKELISKPSNKKMKKVFRHGWELLGISKEEVADIKMQHVIIRSIPSGKYIDLSFLRKHLSIQ